LSLLVETNPGTDTSGSFLGLPPGWLLGDPNTTVCDAADSKTNAIKLLIFIWESGFFMESSGNRGEK
jgi:hypothetical protein